MSGKLKDLDTPLSRHVSIRRRTPSQRWQSAKRKARVRNRRRSTKFLDRSDHSLSHPIIFFLLSSTQLFIKKKIIPTNPEILAVQNFSDFFICNRLTDSCRSCFCYTLYSSLLLSLFLFVELVDFVYTFVLDCVPQLFLSLPMF